MSGSGGATSSGAQGGDNLEPDLCPLELEIAAANTAMARSATRLQGILGSMTNSDVKFTPSLVERQEGPSHVRLDHPEVNSHGADPFLKVNNAREAAESLDASNMCPSTHNQAAHDAPGVATAHDGETDGSS